MGSVIRGGEGRNMMGDLGSPARGSYGPPPASHVPPPPKGFTVDKPAREFNKGKDLVCYKYALYRCDKGDSCRYLHDEDLAIEYIAKMIQLYQKSKHFKPSVNVEDPQLRQFVVTDPLIIEDEWYGYQHWRREHEGPPISRR